QRALAAAARSGDRNRLAAAENQVHPVQHAQAWPVLHHQAPRLEQDGDAHIVCPMSVVGAARAARSPGTKAATSTTASVAATMAPTTLASGQTPSAGCTFETTLIRIAEPAIVPMTAPAPPSSTAWHSTSSRIARGPNPIARRTA